MDRAMIQKRLDYWHAQYDKLTDDYAKLIDGGVLSYEIDDRSLTRFEIPTIRKAIDEAENEIAKYEALLEGLKPRRAFGVMPRDW